MGGELNVLDLGQHAAVACAGGIGEVEGDSGGEPLLKGLFRIEEPFSALLVTVE